MKIGVTFWNNRLHDIPAFLRELNYDYLSLVEVRMEYPDFHASVLKMSTIQKLVAIEEKFGVSFIFHTGITDTNLISFNPDIREASWQTLIKEIKNLSPLAPTSLVIHGGKIWSTTLGGEDYHSVRDSIVEDFIHRLEFTLQLAGELNIQLLLENSPFSKKKVPLISSVEDHFQICSELKSLGLKAVVDTGHALVSHGDVFKHIDQMSGYIQELHIHNNYGKKDEHRGLKQGNIDFMEFFKKYGDRDWNVILEIKDPEELRESLQFLKFVQNPTK